MSYPSFSKGFAAAIAVLPLIAFSSDCFAQAEQVLAEVGVMGRVAGDQGVVRPDFANEGDYTNWVALASNRDFRAFAISVTGTALVLDGNVIREYTSTGAAKTDAGFPVNCTSLGFTSTRPNGRSVDDSLSSCSTFTPLNDGTLRIAGVANVAGSVIISYNPAKPISEAAKVVVSGAPTITEMDADQFGDAGTRKKAGYWAVGDGRKVVFFSLPPVGTEQNYQVIYTQSGSARIDSVTPFGNNRVVVALDTGELLAVNATTGTANSFATLPTGSACGLGRNDPQKFTVRGDPTGTLFAGNRGCRSITLYNATLQSIPLSADLATNPFLLSNPAALTVESLDWQSGLSGDFDGCQGASISIGCEPARRDAEMVIWSMQFVPGSDTTYRLFEFTNLVDCRWSGDRPCPIINCPQADDNIANNEGSCPVRENQVLDLAQVLTRADQSGAFKQAAFGDGPPPKMPIPAIMRGEKCYPTESNATLCASGLVDNNGYRFHSFFAVTGRLAFVRNFFIDYQIDEFRLPLNGAASSADPCVIPPAGSSIAAINETANLIVYNSDSFDTVNRRGAEAKLGGVIINDACNGRASGRSWSAQTIGLELYDTSPTAYVAQVIRMMGELKQARTELLCSAFRNPAGGSLGPLLPAGGPDCASILDGLNQLESKQATCLDSLRAPQSGNSAENCNAFFTKATNLQSILDAAAWPNPNIAGYFDLLRPNYEGEFRGRLATLVFFMQSYVLNGVPSGGIPAS